LAAVVPRALQSCPAGPVALMPHSYQLPLNSHNGRNRTGLPLLSIVSAILVQFDRAVALSARMSLIAWVVAAQSNWVNAPRLALSLTSVV
jgi:hypothetical protein